MSRVTTFLSEVVRTEQGLACDAARWPREVIDDFGAIDRGETQRKRALAEGLKEIAAAREYMRGDP